MSRRPPLSRPGWWAAVVWVLMAAIAPLLSPDVRAEDWPAWRGPRGDGTSLETEVPIRWDGDAGTNILWRAEVPGRGHASPIVCRDRLLTVSCREEEGERLLLCFDRHTGRLLWQRVVLRAPLEKKHPLNSHATSTPATDGTLVYVTFLEPDFDASQLAEGAHSREATPGNVVVAAYDFEGRQRWLARPGRFSSCHGFCSPPLLFENLCIVNGDHDGDSYLVAVDKRTGETVWKTPRRNRTRSYCPPIIRQAAGRTQMVLSGDKSVASYDPRTGGLHWIIDGPTDQFVASPVYNGRYFYITAGFPEFHILALRADLDGDVTDSAVVWRTTKGCAYVPSPIVAGDGKYFLLVSDGGVASCFEANSGQRYWMERIGPHYSASPVLVDGLVYFLSDEGVTTIIRPGPTFDRVAENALGQRVFASPAVSGGRLYLRGEREVWCIGRGAKGNASPP